MFPQKFSIEVYHILNSFFGLMTIVGFYKLNKKEIARLGRGAEKEIKKYTFSGMVKKYEQIYDEIC